MFEFNSDAAREEVDTVSLINWSPDNGLVGAH